MQVLNNKADEEVISLFKEIIKLAQKIKQEGSLKNEDDKKKLSKLKDEFKKALVVSNVMFKNELANALVNEVDPAILQSDYEERRRQQEELYSEYIHDLEELAEDAREEMQEDLQEIIEEANKSYDEQKKLVMKLDNLPETQEKLITKEQEKYENLLKNKELNEAVEEAKKEVDDIFMDAGLESPNPKPVELTLEKEVLFERMRGGVRVPSPELSDREAPEEKWPSANMLFLQRKVFQLMQEKRSKDIATDLINHIRDDFDNKIDFVKGSAVPLAKKKAAAMRLRKKKERYVEQVEPIIKKWLSAAKKAAIKKQVSPEDPADSWKSPTPFDKLKELKLIDE